MPAIENAMFSTNHPADFGRSGVNMAGTDSKIDTPVTREGSRRVRKDPHEERRSREAWALEVVKRMRKSPSAPEPDCSIQPPVLPGSDPDAPGFVYFAYCVGRIKIGYTTDLGNRMAGILTHSPLPATLLLSIRGSKLDELAYHEMFAAEHIHREWFRLSYELRDFLDSKSDDVFHLLFAAEVDFYNEIQPDLVHISTLMEVLNASASDRSAGRTSRPISQSRGRKAARREDLAGSDGRKSGRRSRLLRDGDEAHGARSEEASSID